MGVNKRTLNSPQEMNASTKNASIQQKKDQRRYKVVTNKCMLEVIMNTLSILQKYISYQFSDI